MRIYESVIYQIYPIGFFNAPKENDGIYVPRIKDLINWIPYLKDLGVDAILLNPIFESDTHGYDTKDFNSIDVRLGNNDDFKNVCKQLHEAGIKIILDGVFNHVGRNWTPFLDVKEHKANSQYKDWFIIDWNGNSNYNDGFWYDGWEGHFELVKLNLKNYDLKQYLLNSVKMWMTDFGIDGLRLDVAYSLDHDFLRELRSFTSGLNSDFALIGEVLFGDYNIIVNDSMLQSCTNYECYKGIYSSFNSMNMFEISYSLNRQYGKEDWSIYKGKHLMNFVDNHDVNRLASTLTIKEHLPLAYGLLFTMPGIPCLYYGSEWGVEGKKEEGQNDFGLRPHFDSPMPNELTEYIRKLINLHHNEKALIYGSYENLVVTNPQLAFSRKYENEEIIVLINASDSKFTFHHDRLFGEVYDILCDVAITLDGSYESEPYSISYIKR
ncbi:MAG: alpha-amylase family glycosyl hydrolase [Suipraeoptans sp.]